MIFPHPRFDATKLLVFVVVALATAPRVTASDGVIEINQACAVQTGCMAGDSAGFPVLLVASGSYKMTGNLIVPNANTTAIQIDTSYVTLDLGGFRIEGPRTAGTGDGVLQSEGLDLQNATVRNGSIVGVGRHGVSLRTLARAHDLTIIQSGSDGIRTGRGGLIRSNSIDAAGGHGIIAQGKPGIPFSVCGSWVGDNIIRSSGTTGIDVVGRSLVIRNTVRDSVATGIFNPFSGSPIGYVENTLTNNNGGSGNPQVAGGVEWGFELGPNLCGADTNCP